MSATLTFSIEAEQSVLGSILLDNASLQTIESSGLVAQDFSDHGHRVIFETARKMIASGQSSDVVTLFERLQEDGVTADWGSVAYLNNLAQYVPSAGNARRYASIIKERALRRALVTAATGEGSLTDALTSIDSLRNRLVDGGDQHIELLDVGYMLDNEPPPLDFVLPGLLAGTVGMLVSPGSSGKSMLTAQLCVLVATGVDTIGIGRLIEKPIAQARVVYLTAEDPADIIWTRIKQIAAGFTPAQRKLLRENLVIGDVRGRNADILDPAWEARITQFARGARLVVIDTLRRFHSADENDSGEAAQVLATIEAISRECGTTFLIPHHTNKTGGKEGGGDQQAARGSSVLTDNARLQINLVKMTEKEASDRNVTEAMRGHFVRMVFAKVNYCAPIQDLWLHRKAGGVLEPAHFGVAGAVAQRQPMPGARVEDSVRRGGVVINGRDGWEVLR